MTVGQQITYKLCMAAGVDVTRGMLETMGAAKTIDDAATQTAMRKAIREISNSQDDAR